MRFVNTNSIEDAVEELKSNSIVLVDVRGAYNPVSMYPAFEVEDTQKEMVDFVKEVFKKFDAKVLYEGDLIENQEGVFIFGKKPDGDYMAGVASVSKFIDGFSIFVAIMPNSEYVLEALDKSIKNVYNIYTTEDLKEFEVVLSEAREEEN